MDIAVLGIKSIPAVAGADRVVEKLLENFSPANDYWVYIRKDSRNAASCHDNLHFIQVPALRGKHLGSFSFFFLCCMHYLFKGRYDLAHVHNSDFGLFVPLLRLKRWIPVLGTFHGDPYTRAKWGRLARSYFHLSERFFVQFCDQLTSVSRFKDRGRGLWSERKISYIPNGVDSYWEESTSNVFDYDAHGLEPGNYALFACGRLDSTKGLHHLLEAWSDLAPKMQLLVVGDFGHDIEYSARMDQLMAETPGVVVYRDLLPRHALLDVLRRSRLFLFPSEYEAMSMMLLEAISCKTPVLCSDIPENLELLVEGYPFAHRSRDALSLRDALERWLEDESAAVWADELYERCMTEYSWKGIAREYERYYREMTSNPIKRADAATSTGRGEI